MLYALCFMLCLGVDRVGVRIEEKVRVRVECNYNKGGVYRVRFTVQCKYINRCVHTVKGWGWRGDGKDGKCVHVV